MKRSILFLLLFISFTFSYGQNSPEEEALENIKVGNTLREAQQFAKAEEFLEAGLKEVKGKNKYWEASAYENLGLLYRDQGLSDLAIKNLRKALEIYISLKSKASIKGVRTLLEGVEEKETLYAGIEIGAKGVKLSVIGIYLSIEGYYKFNIKHDDSKNPSIVSMTEKSIDDAVEAVNGFVKDINEKYKIPEERIFIVGSSGVKMAAEEKSKMNLLQEKFSKNIKGYSKEIKFITAEEEAYFVIIGSTLPKYRAISSTLDIGSGNTKGGYLMGEKLEKIEPISFPFGTETFAEFIKDKKFEKELGYDSLANLLDKEVIRKEIKTQIEKKGGLRTRKIVHLIGGVVWAMAAYIYPESADDMFVEVSPQDIAKFRKEIMSKYEIVTVPNLSYITNPELKAKAESDIKKATKSFTREELIAGSIILDDLVRELNKTTSKKFYFARQGYIGWITGLILGSVSKEYEGLED
ncbi:tetratricopeptide repeat protein [Flexithrix dorotheae]|uniref:tetratricopeptide repeat protein n=1 Tax=Flexithrix dorotheae TaxID=70993 RepID=UPI000399AF5A|nr:tetratricopeptide repeat protein [Flexithrix dorotheae]